MTTPTTNHQTTTTDPLTVATKAAGIPDYSVYRYQLDRHPDRAMPTTFTATAHQTLFDIAATLGATNPLAAQALTEIAAEFDTLARWSRGHDQARTYFEQQEQNYRTMATESLSAFERCDDPARRRAFELDNLRAHARMTAYADAVRVMDIATNP